METSVLSIAIMFFLVANPIGNSPAILSLVKDFDFSRQMKIIFREAMISLALAYFFQFFGEMFLDALQIKDYALTLTGGLVIFLVALGMIFHKPVADSTESVKQEPFIVPIATPLISGPGLMTMIMVYSKDVQNDMTISLAILITWIGVTAVLLGAPYLQLLIGKRGIFALEQVMGMILILLSMNMIVSGVNLFLKTLS